MKISYSTHHFPVNARFSRYFPDLTRTTHFVKVPFPDGKFGIGEFSYLPSVHKTDPHALVRQLEENPTIAYGEPSNFQTIPYPKSYVLSMAHLCHRFLTTEKIPLKQFSLQALIVEEDPSCALEQARFLIDQGFCTIKVKINGAALLQSVEKVKLILNNAPKEVRLRLDANQSFSLNDAQKLIASIDMSRIDYIEEPTKNPEEWPQCMATKLAADESFFSWPLATLKAFGVSHLIIRPSSFHDLYSLESTIDNALHSGMRIVLSHAFETPFTRDVLALFLSLFSAIDLTHGLYEGDFVLTNYFGQAPRILTTTECLKRVRSFHDSRQ